MKKRLRFTLSLCTLFFLAIGSSYSQITINDCYDFSQVCRDCYCLMVYEPVCGCNDVTYSNSCFAYISGITSWTEGACGSFSSTNEGGERPDLFFRSPNGEEVLMEILNQEGEVVATPLQGRVEAGQEYLINTQLPAGDYLCQVTTETEVLCQTFSME